MSLTVVVTTMPVVVDGWEMRDLKGEIIQSAAPSPPSAKKPLQRMSAQPPTHRVTSPNAESHTDDLDATESQRVGGKNNTLRALGNQYGRADNSPVVALTGQLLLSSLPTGECHAKTSHPDSIETAACSDPSSLMPTTNHSARLRACLVDLQIDGSARARSYRVIVHQAPILRSRSLVTRHCHIR